jgi:hypothetical protein
MRGGVKRKHIPCSVKLASALLQMKRPDETGKLVPIIPHEDAKLMTAEQIISLFHFDHYPVRHADGGADEPHNLQPELIAPHRIKTAKIDVPEIAKSRRIRAKQEETRRRILARDAGEEKPRSKWGTRKIQSRGFR